MGVPLGRGVGVGVPAGVGVADPDPLGVAVGVFVGDPVGAVVGEVVGEAVGAGVGVANPRVTSCVLGPVALQPATAAAPSPMTISARWAAEKRGTAPPRRRGA